MTQVLSDGTNTYLYGNDRLAQYQASMQYFGADGLGSVRQLYDAGAQVIGNSRYDPYGNVMSHSGGTSVFAFAGEQQDATGLSYLRARYYSAAQGRFTTRDVWPGDYALPGTLDRWVYVRNNPVNFLDPTGRITRDQATEAREIVERLNGTYQVTIFEDWGPYTTEWPANAVRPAVTINCWENGAWNLTDLKLVEEALKLITGGNGMRDPANFIRAMDGHLKIWRSTQTSAAYSPPVVGQLTGDIVLTNGTFGGSLEYQTYSVIHEVGHVWDYRRGGELHEGLMSELKTVVCNDQSCWWDPYANPEVPAGAQLGCTVDEIKQGIRDCGGRNVPYAFTYGGAPTFTKPGAEDWADSFADVIYPAYQQSESRTNLETGRTRERYVRDQLNNVH